MTNHPPEPWYRGDDGFIHDAAGTSIATFRISSAELYDRDAAVARAIACVNACAGINPEAVKDLVEALKIFGACADYIYQHHPDGGKDTGLWTPEASYGATPPRITIGDVHKARTALAKAKLP